MRDDTLYMLAATSDCGMRVNLGPYDIGEAITVVDQHILPGGWTVKYLPTMPVPDAMRIFAVGRRRPGPIPGQDLFVALRRAIITDQDNDGAECSRAAAMIAHLEGHRPLPMYQGDEECLLAECDHPEVGGLCTGLTPLTPLCVSCSAVHDTNTEWGLDWIAALRIEWPCAPIRKAAAHYNIELPAEVNTSA